MISLNYQIIGGTLLILPMVEDIYRSRSVNKRLFTDPGSVNKRLFTDPS